MFYTQASSGVFLIVALGERSFALGIRWVEVKDVGKHPTMYRTAPTTNSYLPTKVKVGKLFNHKEYKAFVIADILLTIKNECIYIELIINSNEKYKIKFIK